MVEIESTSVHSVPTKTETETLWRTLQPLIKETPVAHFNARDVGIAGQLKTNLWLKLELLQYAGSFKTRAVMGMLNAFEQQGRVVPGVVTASGGNYALALAYAAKQFSVNAVVVMPKQASPLRIQGCRDLGAEVILVDSVAQVFDAAMDYADTHGFEFIHPFDGFQTSLGTSTLAYEFLKSVPPLDYIVVPVGGGGLISGVAAYVKQALPSCEVIGVEPVGANVISQALAAGKTLSFPQTKSIADSLCSPLACEYSFSLIQRYVDRIVTLEESEIISAIQTMQTAFKLAVEPAAACGLGAVLGPIREELGVALEDKNIGVVVCGSNVDTERYGQLLTGVV